MAKHTIRVDPAIAPAVKKWLAFFQGKVCENYNEPGDLFVTFKGSPQVCNHIFAFVEGWKANDGNAEMLRICGEPQRWETIKVPVLVPTPGSEVAAAFTKLNLIEQSLELQRCKVEIGQNLQQLSRILSNGDVEPLLWRRVLLRLTEEEQKEVAAGRRPLEWGVNLVMNRDRAG